MRIKLFSILAVAVTLSSCNDDRWEAIVYKDKSNLSDYEILDVYESLDRCRDVAVSYLYNSNLHAVGDYECGLNCEFRQGWGNTRICEVTER